tara:strand:+ start:252 stop:518 length:267 start_codon:yes stop_codon:yes gene_type:complete
MLKNILNIFIIISIVVFFFGIFKYYSSNHNIKKINLNRENIEQILKNKVVDITVLPNDTNDVIEFNSSFADEIKNDEPRSFWKLLKFE